MSERIPCTDLHAESVLADIERREGAIGGQSISEHLHTVIAQAVAGHVKELQGFVRLQGSQERERLQIGSTRRASTHTQDVLLALGSSLGYKHAMRVRYS